ncbi:5-methyltetrahydropteroyltriglutamate--homocysteine methyltransferase [Dissostichus eleginoides]|uniref:5-methyltetrahydropteroyltriglutamate--homocysteine methyltransferase n=1 Tax=Dissostichus eleginoides TaxID=100907 RepID=A0AAD9C7K1_DISEL|nr:5-methyltetrahydropteroyltriglutamate--homocysteine methyltransferase [Dissostichus eleginoides]
MFASPHLLSPSPPSGSCMGAGSLSEHQGSRNRSTAVSLCCPEKCSLVWDGASAAWGRALVPPHAALTRGLLRPRSVTSELCGRNSNDIRSLHNSFGVYLLSICTLSHVSLTSNRCECGVKFYRNQKAID